ncbi:MAG: sigma 54-interacting transcriptional regulator [Desulfobacterales bacterium]|nr:sigma 54-interacting transcriptional regulator [Desulfobacterales bacterium]
MILSREIWTEMNRDERKCILFAALIPPPVSLEMWSNAADISILSVLQLAENMIQENIFSKDKAMGAGHYFFSDPLSTDAILRWADSKDVQRYAREMISFFEKEYPAGPKYWMAVSHLYQTAEIHSMELPVLIKAVQYCSEIGSNDAALEYQKLIVGGFQNQNPTEEEMKGFIDAAIGFCGSTGESLNLNDQKAILDKTLVYAQQVGDQERLIQVLILAGDVHKELGELEKAKALLNQGAERVRLTQRDDLLTQISLKMVEILNWQGRLGETIESYEKFLGKLEQLPQDEISLWHCACLGWIYGKCGQPMRGLGLINAVIRKAEQLHLDKLEKDARAWSVITLLDAGRVDDAEHIIDDLLSRSPGGMNDHLISSVYSAKAYVLCCKSEFKGSLEFLNKSYLKTQRAGKIHFRHRFDFECIETLESAGFIHPEVNYDKEIDKMIHSPTTYFQGIGYYYRARKMVKQKKDPRGIERDLSQSLSILEQSGSKLDMAHSQILMARLLMTQGRNGEAEQLIEKAWAVLKFVNCNLFPKDLKRVVVRETEIFSISPLIEIVRKLGVLHSKHELLKQVVDEIIRMTGADLGAYFVYNQKNQIELAASRNLTNQILQTQSFQPSLKDIETVLETGKEIIQSKGNSPDRDSLSQGATGWEIVYPIELRGEILGCFYLERELSGPPVSQRVLSEIKLVSTVLAMALDNVEAYGEIAQLKDEFEAETLFYRNEFSNVWEKQNMVGKSPAMQEVITKIKDVAPSDATVLICGETGVGKELVAKAIHRFSNRSTGPFISVSIASLSDNLVPSELFGHEKGAFTDAVQSRKGRFELANKGSLFLDEINSLSKDTQAGLLRVLEEKSFERVGGSLTIQSGFRLITACNQPLDQLVKKGKFRSDLFYRINVYPIDVPPLRERIEDIPILVNHFVSLFNKKFNKQIDKISKKGMKQLMRYHWPGNVRELKHVIERAVISCKSKQLHFSQLDLPNTDLQLPGTIQTFQEMERSHILKALKRCNWKVSGNGGAALLLDLNPQTLYSKMNRLGIKRKWA